MTQQQQNVGHIMIEDVIIAFAHGLWQAQQVQGQGRPAFSSSFLFAPSHPATNIIYQAMQAVARQKWGEQGDAILQSLVAGGRVCLRDGNSKPDLAGYKGNYFISARSPTRPLVIDQNRMPVDETSGVIYSGAHVNAKIAIWAQQNQHGRRINAQLQGVQKLRDGEPLSGGGTADVEDFGVVAGDAQPSAEFGGNLASGQPQLGTQLGTQPAAMPGGQQMPNGAGAPVAPVQPAAGQPQPGYNDLIGGGS